MKITKISILNFLGLSAFKADKLGKLNRLIGDNGVGKSSVLLAIKEAFKSSGVDPYMIRTDADKAEIMIEVDERMSIERWITPTANNVQVTVDGQPLPKPQTFLASLLGLGSNFNPVDFFSPKPPKGMTPARYRRELLLSAMPFTIDPEALQKLLWPDGKADTTNYIDWDTIDFSKHGLTVLAQIQKVIYDRRHAVGIELTRQKKSIEQDKRDLPETTDANKFKGFDLNTKVAELGAAKVAIGQHGADKDQLESLRNRDIEITNSIAHHKEEIARLEAEQEKLRKNGATLKAKIDKFTAPDIESLEQQIVAYESHRTLIHRFQDIERREAALDTSKQEYDSLDDLYKSLTTEVPHRMLTKMKLPIDGLEIKGDDILINDVAIDKLSDSERIKLGLEIAKALSGKLQVICVDRFECLDGKSKKLFEQATRNDEFEYFFTIVNQDPDASGDLRLEVEDEAPGELPLKTSKKPTPEKPKTKRKAGF